MSERWNRLKRIVQHDLDKAKEDWTGLQSELSAEASATMEGEIFALEAMTKVIEDLEREHPYECCELKER